MGKWSENEEQMKTLVRDEIITAIWQQIGTNLDREERIKKFFILKIVLGLIQDVNKQYVPTKGAHDLDNAIRESKFDEFKAVFDDNQITYEQLAMIQAGEHLSLSAIDSVDPNILEEDTNNLNAYIQEKGINASVQISNKNGVYTVTSEKFDEPNPLFSIHSIGKTFMGLLVMKMISEGKMSENDLTEKIQLDKDVLDKLSTDVKTQLAGVSLKDVMLHNSGLGDYLDNPTGHTADIAEKLNNGMTIPVIQSSHDLLKYAAVDVAEFPRYSNLGILLVGFAIEKKYQDWQRANQQAPWLKIDEIMQRFAKDEIGMNFFETHMPENGRFNSTDQRFKDTMVNLTQDEKEARIKSYVAGRFGSPAGGYWTTNEDLQKFGTWIQNKWQTDPQFKKLVKAHGGEFYNPGKQAIEHSGSHADTAHFYTSLRNGTTISVLSDQGNGAATNLVGTILQIAWYKNKLESKHASPKNADKRKPAVAPGFKSVRHHSFGPTTSPKSDQNTEQIKNDRVLKKPRK